MTELEDLLTGTLDDMKDIINKTHLSNDISINTKFIHKLPDANPINAHDYSKNFNFYP